MADDEDKIKAQLDALQPAIEAMAASMATGLTPEQLRQPPTLRYVNLLVAELTVIMKHGAVARIEALERKLGIVKNAKPIKRSVTNVTAHDAQGRIVQTEKLEGGEEEIDIFARLVAVEKRLAEGGLRYRGVWQKAEQYREGDFATHAGSVWAALIQSKGVKPGESQGCWQLAVKSGRDGKDAKMLEPVIK